MAKNKKTIADKQKIADICYLTRDVLQDCIEYAENALQILEEKTAAAGILDPNTLVRLSVERTITNIHQLWIAYKKCGLILEPVEDESYKRIKTIRYLIDHAETSFEQIDTQFKSRCASIRVGPGRVFMHYNPADTHMCAT